MSPSFIIVFDSERWKPTAVIVNGKTDIETAKLQEIANKLLRAVEEDDK